LTINHTYVSHNFPETQGMCASHCNTETQENNANCLLANPMGNIQNLDKSQFTPCDDLFSNSKHKAGFDDKEKVLHSAMKVKPETVVQSYVRTATRR